MRASRFLLLAMAMTVAQVHAQSPAEISFWESVRDSKNPLELEAYLDQYPNGQCAAPAKVRLAALPKATAQPAPPKERSVVAATAPASRYPSAGDTWTYRLSHPRLRGQWGQRTRPEALHVVQIDS